MIENCHDNLNPGNNTSMLRIVTILIGGKKLSIVFKRDDLEASFMFFMRY